MIWEQSRGWSRIGLEISFLALALLQAVVAGEVEAAETALRLDLSRADRGVEEVGARIRLESTSGSGGAGHRRVSVTIPGAIEVLLPEGSSWILSLEAPGLWTRRRLVKLGPRGATIEIVAYPAVVVSGRLLVPPGETLPGEVELRFRPAAGSAADSDLPPGLQPCPVGQDGTLVCALPRGTMDLRVAAEGYVPLYRWRVDLAEKESGNLGGLGLRRGASLSGWIQAPGRRVDLAATRAQLVPEVAGYSDPRVGIDRDVLRRHEQQIDERGFFQIVGIEPGRYTLRVEHPVFVPTFVPGIEVVAGSEVALDPFELDPGADLEIELRQPTDPYAQPWLVELHGQRTGGGRWVEAAKMSATLEGSWNRGGLPVGDYLVFVRDSRGDRWVSEGLTLYPGANHHRIDISIERFEGRLLMPDGEPLAGASVQLRQHEGNTRLKRTSDEEGRFYVFLLRGARWDIEVRHPEQGVLSYFSQVEVPEPRAGEPWPRRNLEIPETRLFGRVVDSLDQPIEDPVVLGLNQEGKDRGFRLGWPFRGGIFSVRGLPPGLLGLGASFDGSATEKRGDTEPVEVEVVDGGEIGPMRLVLEESQRHSGMVVGPTGEGVAGAMILAKRLRGLDRAMATEVASGFTDQDGIFELDLPAATSRVLFTVLPPGFALTQAEIDLASAEAIVLPVDPSQAMVTITYESPDDAWRPDLRRKTFLMGAHVVSGGALARWSALQPRTGGETTEVWTIPGLSPGPYRACFRNRALDPYLISGAPLPSLLIETSCSEEGWAAPGMTLSLEIHRRAIERGMGGG